MFDKNDEMSLAQALVASLGNVAAFFRTDQQADFAVVIGPNAVEIRIQALPESLPTLKQLGQVLLPFCLVDRGAQIHVVQHGDAALNTQLPVEALLHLEEGVLRVDSITSIPSVSSVSTIDGIAGLSTRGVKPGGAVVWSPLDGVMRGTMEGMQDLLVDYIHTFAIVHAAAMRAPLHFDYQVFERRGAISPHDARAGFDGHLMASGTSGFSVQVGSRTFAASVTLWAESRRADSPSGTELVCFDAGGILPDRLARKALAKCQWKRRGGLAYRARQDGALFIENEDLRVLRIVLYVYPIESGGSSGVVSSSDTPEGLARSAINTAVSSLRAVGVGDRGLGAVDEAIDQMTACLRRVRARAWNGGYERDGWTERHGASSGAPVESSFASSLRRILAPAR